MLSRIDVLTKFRQAVYSFFLTRGDAIMNLLDAISSYGHKARSVVQLSEANCFEREYSSITDAISDGLPAAQWSELQSLVFDTCINRSTQQPLCFVIDCTPNPRPFAKHLEDKTIVHYPNPAPGNKPICVGHTYSCAALLPTDQAADAKKWLVPLSMKRVRSEDKGNEVGVKQVLEHINQLGLAEQLTLCVGDSLYSSERCRIEATNNEHFVLIARLNSTRNVYCQPKDIPTKRRGRKKRYGDKMALRDPSTHPEPTKQEEHSWTTRSGKRCCLKITTWNDMLLRGSREYDASKHPMTLLRVELFDEAGNQLFKRPLWLAVFGSRRKEVSSLYVAQNYFRRYNIEHFFRFGKTKLLLDAYQTPDVSHEQDWWSLCMLAYNQLYLAKSLVPQCPKSWEKYLPEYKDTQVDPDKIITPSQTQRGFANLLRQIGTPARPCVRRGHSTGRQLGETQNKRTEQTIIFKSSSKKAVQNIIISGSEQQPEDSNPKEIQRLLKTVVTTIEKFDITLAKFTQMLLDSG